MNKINIKFDESLFNETFYDCYKSKSLYLHLWGGKGSGKSYNAAWKIIIRMMNEKDHRFLVIRKVARTLKNSCFLLFQDIIAYNPGLAKLFKFNLSDYSITFIPNGNQILMGGLDDATKLFSIQGITGTWIEEAIELTQDDWLKLDASIRPISKHYEQNILTYNPVDINSWIKKEFHDKIFPESELQWSSVTQNKFATEKYISKLERLASLDPAYHKIFMLGEWAVLKGLIYPEYKVTSDFPDTPIVYGMDFGFEHPTALTSLQIENRKLYCRSIIYESGLTIPDVINKMNSFGINKYLPIYADNSRPEAIEDIKRAGFNIKPATKGAGSVLEGIMNVKQYEIYLHNDSIELQNEFKMYKWRTNSSGEPITPEQPVKLKDDGVDSVRYGIQGFTSEKDWEYPLELSGLPKKDFLPRNGETKIFTKHSVKELIL